MRTIRLPLNLVDWLYMFYLACMGTLALWLRPPGSAKVILTAHALIAVAIFLLAAKRESSSVIRFLHDWYPLAMFIFSFEEVARFALVLVPHWQNDLLVRFEHNVFGGSPNLWMGRFASPWLSEILDAGYFSYYPMFPVVGGLLYARQDKRPFRELMLASVLMYYVAFAAYLLFPVQSPLHAAGLSGKSAVTGVFTWLVHTVQGQAGVHGNAFPSSHVALAFLCVAFAWRHARKAAIVLVPCFVLISASGVYDGYHYLSDVFAGILAALTALGIQRLISSRLANLFTRV